MLFDDDLIAWHEIDREGVLRRINRAECVLPGHDAAGEVAGMRSVLVDITDRVRAETVLAAGEARFRAPLSRFGLQWGSRKEAKC